MCDPRSFLSAGACDDQSKVPGMGMIDRLERRAGQVLLGATFIKLGFDAALHPGSRVDKAAALGLPNPELAVRGNGTAMVAGGMALTLDKLPRLAALGLIASMIPTTLAGHAYWHFDSTERKVHEIQFLKNAGLVGGLLLVLAPAEWPPVSSQPTVNPANANSSTTRVAVTGAGHSTSSWQDRPPMRLPRAVPAT
jgi:putative oxidoreductase